jgi:hypothetical protein
MAPKELAKNVAYMRRHSESVGRASPPGVSFRATLNFTGDSASGHRPPLHGSTEDVIADLQEYSEAGVDHTIMEISGDGYPDMFRSMERFMTEVKPRVSA